MKHKYNIILIVTFILFSYSGSLKGQDKTYWSTGFEMLFSFADIEQDGISKSSIIRWAPVFNVQTFFNYDATKNFGLFTGIGVRNVGFIYDQDDATRKKYRTYNMGIPVGIKAGNFEKAFVFAGYEIEFPFNYKEKTFVNDVKSKYTEWFTDRVPTVYHTLGGLRHFIWDKYPNVFLNNKAVARSSMLLFGLTVPFTFLSEKLIKY